MKKTAKRSPANTYLLSGFLLGSMLTGSIFAFFLSGETPNSPVDLNPNAEFPKLPQSHFTLEKSGFYVGYDGRLKQPSWTYEELQASDLRGNAERSGKSFCEDPNLPEAVRSTLDDYKKTGFDRGHLVPAADCKKSEDKLDDSFLLSNISPQVPTFNRGYWLKLEKHARKLAQSKKRVKVISGPIFMPEEALESLKMISYQALGNSNVAVPTHFFKVISWNKGSEAYIVPNSPIELKTPLSAFLVSTDDIEKAAGINLNI